MLNLTELAFSFSFSKRMWRQGSRMLKGAYNLENESTTRWPGGRLCPWETHETDCVSFFHISGAEYNAWRNRHATHEGKLEALCPMMQRATLIPGTNWWTLHGCTQQNWVAMKYICMSGSSMRVVIMNYGYGVTISVVLIVLLIEIDCCFLWTLKINASFKKFIGFRVNNCKCRNLVKHVHRRAFSWHEMSCCHTAVTSPKAFRKLLLWFCLWP